MVAGEDISEGTKTVTVQDATACDVYEVQVSWNAAETHMVSRHFSTAAPEGKLQEESPKYRRLGRLRESLAFM